MLDSCFFICHYNKVYSFLFPIVTDCCLQLINKNYTNVSMFVVGYCLGVKVHVKNPRFF